MRKLFALILFSIIPLQPANSSEADHWNYVGLSRVQIDFDNSNEDAKGFGLDAIHAISESFVLSGKYQQYSISAADVDRLLVGIGGKYNTGINLTPYAQLNYVYTESTSGALNASIKYWLANVGVSGGTHNFTYKVGLSRYQGISEGLDDESGYFAELFYSFNNSISAGLEFESVDDDVLYNFTARYHF